MQYKTFEKGSALLLAVFPHLKIESLVFYDFLKDIDDAPFIEAIKNIIRNTKELYPNTNLIAVILEQVKIVKPKYKLTNKELLELEQKIIRERSNGHTPIRQLNN